MGCFYLFQSRSKLQFVCFCLIVSIVLVVVFKGKTVYYQQYNSFQPSYQNAKKIGVTSTYNRSKYNLMEDLPGFGKLTQFFSYGNDECTLGNYID